MQPSVMGELQSATGDGDAVLMEREQSLLSKHSHAKSFPLQVQEFIRSKEDLFQAVLLGSFQMCSGFNGVKEKSHLDPACSVKEHQEVSTALRSSWPSPLADIPLQLHRKEPSTFSSFQEVNGEEWTVVFSQGLWAAG